MLLHALIDALMSGLAFHDTGGVTVIQAAERLPPLSDVIRLGLGAVCAWAATALYGAESSETALVGERADEIRRPTDTRVVAGLSLLSLKNPSPGESPRGPGASPDQSTGRDNSDTVHVSAFAPPVLAPGEEFYLQIILHSSEQLATAEAAAQEFEGLSRMIKTLLLTIPIPDGAEIRITIDGRGVEIADPVQIFTWRGRVAHIVFASRVPPASIHENFFPLIRVFVNGAPAGVMKLELHARRDGSDLPALPVAREALRFRKVFISYATEDRPTVLRMVQMLKVMRTDFFQDLLSLEPGERWEKGLYREIAECDAFFLFWSSKARDSSWVIKEAKLALEQQKNTGSEIPQIIPIIIEGPPIVKPPKELSHLQFNDPLQHIIYAEKAAAAV